MSPAAVTSGAATLSMSQPKRTEPAATPSVRRRTKTDDTAPPIIEITTKSAMEIVCVKPKPMETALASTARAKEIESVSAIDATMFWPTTVFARRLRLNVPVWMAVPRRLPRAPKTLPRMPMAAGTRTSRPGSSLRVWVMAPRVSPASRSPPEETSRAARPCRTLAASEPSRPRSRAPKRRRSPPMARTRRFRHHCLLQSAAHPRRELALAVGTGALDGDADDDALLALHGPAVVVPVGMLAGDAPVVVDERFHGFRQGDDRRLPLDQDPRPEELVAQDAQPQVGVAPQVADLVGRLPAADDREAVVVEADGDRRERR